MPKAKQSNVKTLERVMKLMEKYRCEYVEWQGMKLIKNKFTGPATDATIPKAQPSAAQTPQDLTKQKLLFGQEIP